MGRNWAKFCLEMGCYVRRTAQVKRTVFWNLGQILVDLNLAHAPFFCNLADVGNAILAFD
jgi:hypothetical protein